MVSGLRLAEELRHPDRGREDVATPSCQKDPAEVVCASDKDAFLLRFFKLA